jgi:hypothetical protein
LVAAPLTLPAVPHCSGVPAHLIQADARGSAEDCAFWLCAGAFVARARLARPAPAAAARPASGWGLSAQVYPTADGALAVGLVQDESARRLCCVSSVGGISVLDLDTRAALSPPPFWLERLERAASAISSSVKALAFQAGSLLGAALLVRTGQGVTLDESTSCPTRLVAFCARSSVDELVQSVLAQLGVGAQGRASADAPSFRELRVALDLIAADRAERAQAAARVSEAAEAALRSAAGGAALDASRLEALLPLARFVFGARWGARPRATRASRDSDQQRRRVAQGAASRSPSREWLRAVCLAFSARRLLQRAESADAAALDAVAADCLRWCASWVTSAWQSSEAARALPLLDRQLRVGASRPARAPRLGL